MELVLCVIGRDAPVVLILLPLFGRHVRCLRIRKQRLKTTLRFRGEYLFARRDHAAHHAAHLISEPHVQSLQRLVDVEQPSAEALEQLALLRARRLAFEQPSLEAARELFVSFAPLIDGQCAPLGRGALEANPIEQGLDVLLELSGRVRPRREVSQNLEEKVPRLVQERG